MRRTVPSSWTLVVAAVGLLTVAATIFRTSEIDNVAAWLLLGVAITLIAEWAAVEVYRTMSNFHDDDGRGDDSGA